jgi:hypothetical protein
MMTSWLLVLLLFLWVAGGFGWVDSYEAREEKGVSWLSAAIMVIFWPVFAVALAVGELWQTLRQLMRNDDGSPH